MRATNKFLEVDTTPAIFNYPFNHYFEEFP